MAATHWYNKEKWIWLPNPTMGKPFPGQYFDDETGLYYNFWRDYDPEVGRYLEKDPIGLASGFNLYHYSESNPIRFIDPAGLASGSPVSPVYPPTEWPTYFKPPSFYFICIVTCYFECPDCPLKSVDFTVCEDDKMSEKTRERHALLTAGYYAREWENATDCKLKGGCQIKTCGKRRHLGYKDNCYLPFKDDPNNPNRPPPANPPPSSD